MPKRMHGKVCLRTIRNRLKEKGYVPTPKAQKAEADEKTRRARLAFCREHGKRTGPQWLRFLQGVGDFKLYTYYPKELKMRFSRYRATWTYMKKSERLKPAFVRPKTMFKRAEYTKTIKGKVFGLTLSNGRSLLCHVTAKLTATEFAKLVRERIGPFVREAFPGQNSYRILLDGEPLMHAPEAKAALEECGIKLLQPWPAYSPDLNPQENVWPWLGKTLRRDERDTDSLGTFRTRLTRLATQYPNPEGLIASMPGRIATCLQKHGAMTEHRRFGST